MKHHEILTNTEKLKETIYGLVTLFATCVGILLHITHTSAGGALGLMLGTAVSLWLACFFADILAQSITIADKTKRKHAYKHAFDASLGILIAGRMPVLFLAIAWLGFVSLKGAVIASLVAISVQLFLLTLLSLMHRKNDGLMVNLLTIGIQAVIFFIIIWLKVGH